MLRVLAFLALFALPASAQTWPAPLDQYAIDGQVSAPAVSSHVFVAPLKTLRTLTVQSGASAGKVIVFDATSLPANGAVTPCTTNATTRPCYLWCVPLAATSSVSAEWSSPLRFTSGIVAAFSTGADCNTLTASATAQFSGQTP